MVQSVALLPRNSVQITVYGFKMEGGEFICTIFNSPLQSIYHSKVLKYQNCNSKEYCKNCYGVKSSEIGP